MLEENIYEKWQYAWYIVITFYSQVAKLFEHPSYLQCALVTFYILGESEDLLRKSGQLCVICMRQLDIFWHILHPLHPEHIDFVKCLSPCPRPLWYPGHARAMLAFLLHSVTVIFHYKITVLGKMVKDERAWPLSKPHAIPWHCPKFLWHSCPCRVTRIICIFIARDVSILYDILYKNIHSDLTCSKILKKYTR